MSFYNDALQQNNTEIQSNNTELQGLLDTINALPAAKPEQTKTATPSLSQQTISPDSGKVLSGVTVEPITSTLLTSLDPDFKAENIAEGVNMFGLVGTMAAASVEYGWFEVSLLSYGSDTYKIPFVIGMTWREWIETTMNMELHTSYGTALPMRANENCVDVYYVMMGAYWTLSESGIVDEPVSLDDTIINEFAYAAYGSAAGGYD